MESPRWGNYNEFHKVFLMQNTYSKSGNALGVY